MQLSSGDTLHGMRVDVGRSGGEGEELSTKPAVLKCSGRRKQQGWQKAWGKIFCAHVLNVTLEFHPSVLEPCFHLEFKIKNNPVLTVKPQCLH